LGVVVVAAGAALKERARSLAASLSLPFVAEPPAEGVLLELGAPGLGLRLAGPKASGLVTVELVEGRVGRRRREPSLLKSPLARAVGVAKGARPFVVDATAGLGADSALLAWMGCRVVATERSAVLAALWRDALERAADSEEGRGLLGRLTFEEGDARALLARLRDEGAPPDAVYLDPMFPSRDKTALVKKEMQALQRLLGEDQVDARELLEAARAVAGSRVVVKRPRGAPPLAPNVAHAFEGATTRLDLYLRRPA
jgi:16S rRNA (guanine1516-N2)-methyltransferase